MRNQSKDETRLTGKVVLDAMGSDHAPHPEIDGALAAARDFGIKVILVGQPEKVEPELKRCGWRGDGDRGIELVEAAEVIGMGEPVMNSVRLPRWNARKMERRSRRGIPGPRSSTSSASRPCPDRLART